MPFNFISWELTDNNQLRLTFDKGFGVAQTLRLDLGLTLQPGAEMAIASVLNAAESFTMEPLLLDGELAGDVIYQPVGSSEYLSLSEHLISQGVATPQLPAFSGDYNDLANLPTLFSGDYNDLANLPTLFSGSYDDLSDRPILFSGNYDDLAGLPDIPEAGTDYVPATGGTFTGQVSSNSVIRTTNHLIAGDGSGSIALTVNDGQGNANLTFNHVGGVPDSTGSSVRLVTWVDTGQARLEICLNSNITPGVVNPRNSVYEFNEAAFVPTVSGSVSLGTTVKPWSSCFVSDSVTIGSTQLTEPDLTELLALPGSQFSGDYNDLANLPTLFSGSWNDLSDRPMLFDGAWSSLTGTPATYPTSWDMIANKPTSFGEAPGNAEAEIDIDAQHTEGIYSGNGFTIEGDRIVPASTFYIVNELYQNSSWTHLLVIDPGTLKPYDYYLSFTDDFQQTVRLNYASNSSLLVSFPGLSENYNNSFRRWPLLVITISFDLPSQELRLMLNNQLVTVASFSLSRDGDIAITDLSAISASILEIKRWDESFTGTELSAISELAFSRHRSTNLLGQSDTDFSMIYLMYPGHSATHRLISWLDDRFYIQKFNTDYSNLQTVLHASESYVVFSGDIRIPNAPTIYSDSRMKTGIRELSAAESRVALRLAPKIFQWTSAVEAKGVAARLHCGAIAQEVEAAFQAEGLDPDRYGINCTDCQWEYSHPQMGQILAASLDEVPPEHQAGAVERETKSVRLSELYAFAFASVLVEIRALKDRVSTLEAQLSDPSDQ